MYSLLVLGLTSALLSLVLTPLVRNLTRHFGLVDKPDHQRKIHSAPIPRMGGVAIFAAVVLAYGLLIAARFGSGAILWNGMPLILRLFPAFAVIFSTGLIDDILNLPPWIKLTGEIVAAILAWLGGIHVSALAGHSFSSVAVSFVVTLMWIIVCTNAINLIDGVDGLAAGVSLFAALTMLIAAILGNNFPMALAIIPLVGALLGFLRYNFNPASIFLGDCGSLSLGFLLGCYGAVWSEKYPTLIGLTAPLLVFAVPLLDVGLSICRRFIQGKPIFAADREHIHHKLLSKGMTTRRLVLILYGACAICATASLLLTVSHNRNRDFVIVLICLAAWLGVQHLGYNEFSAAGRVVLGGAFRSVLSAQLALDTFEYEVHAVITLQEYWDPLCRACPLFGFSGIEFHIDNVNRQWGIKAGWQARIDFPGHGYINLWREIGSRSRGAAAVLFVDSVSRIFNQRLNNTEDIVS